MLEWLDRPIAFHPAFVRLTGSVAAGLLLSQILYWSRRTSDPDGWFYKTADDWDEEIGLSRTELELSRKRLTQLGIVDEKRKGVPARLYYRLNEEELVRLLEGGDPAFLEDDEARVADLLKRYGVVISRLNRNHFERAKEMGVKTDAVDLREVVRRDRLVCGICSKPITRGPGRQPGALQFDHVKALCEGGSHALENLRCVHSECHTARPQTRLLVHGQSSLLVHGQTGLLDSEQSGLFAGEQTISETTTETSTEITNRVGESTPPQFVRWWDANPDGLVRFICEMVYAVPQFQRLKLNPERVVDLAKHIRDIAPNETAVSTTLDDWKDWNNAQEPYKGKKQPDPIGRIRSWLKNRVRGWAIDIKKQRGKQPILFAGSSKAVESKDAAEEARKLIENGEVWNGFRSASS